MECCQNAGNDGDMNGHEQPQHGLSGQQPTRSVCCQQYQRSHLREADEPAIIPYGTADEFQRERRCEAEGDQRDEHDEIRPVRHQCQQLGIRQYPDAGVQHQPDQHPGLMADLRSEDAAHRHHQNAKLHGAEDAEQEEHQRVKAAPEVIAAQFRLGSQHRLAAQHRAEGRRLRTAEHQRLSGRALRQSGKEPHLCRAAARVVGIERRLLTVRRPQPEAELLLRAADAQHQAFPHAFRNVIHGLLVCFQRPAVVQFLQTALHQCAVGVFLNTAGVCHPQKDQHRRQPDQDAQAPFLCCSFHKVHSAKYSCARWAAWSMHSRSSSSVSNFLLGLR